MNDTQLLQRLTAANAYGADAELPEAIWSRDLALREIERRTGMTQPTDQPTLDQRPTPERPRNNRGLLVAVATFAVVVLIGAVVAFALTGADDEPAADPTTTTAPATSTTAATTTTQSPTTTTVADTPSALGDIFLTGELPAGTYATERFPVTMVFDLSDGWSSLREDTRGSLLLGRSPIGFGGGGIGPEDGLAVVIRQLEASPSDLAEAIVGELDDTGLVLSRHLVSSRVADGEFAGYPATIVDFEMDDETDLIALRALWPYSAEDGGGVSPMVGPGQNRIVLIDIDNGLTLTLSMMLRDGGDAAQSFAQHVEDLFSTSVTLVPAG